VIEQVLILACLVAVTIVVSIVVYYKTVYSLWLFMLPFCRNLVNIQTPVLDLKLSYLLFLPAFLGWIYSAWRKPEISSAREFRRLHVALGILLGATVLTILASPAPLAGMRVVARTCYIIAVVLVSISVFSSREWTIKVLKVWTASLVAATVLGFVFYISDVLPGGYTIAVGNGAATVQEVGQDLLAEYDIDKQATAVKRYALGFGNLYDTSADFGMLGLFLLVGWASYSRRGNISLLPWFGVGVCALAVLLTYSRGAWLCSIPGIFFLAYAQKWHWRLLVVLATGFAFVVLTDPAKVADRAVSVDASVVGRMVRLSMAADLIAKHPIAGAGPGVFTQELTAATVDWKWFDPDADVSAHSAIIEYLGDQGIVGLAALAWLLVGYFGLGWKIVKRQRAHPERSRGMACAVFAAFVVLTLHSFALPAFEDSFWATAAIGYVLAVQVLNPRLSLYRYREPQRLENGPAAPA
jgi:O-antigen ligase